MAPPDGTYAHSSGSEASTIKGEEPKEIILPVWGILVPPVAQDWINAGFRVSFETNPATVKTWMVTENGLVRVVVNDAPGTDPRAAEQNPVDMNVQTVPDVFRLCSVKSQAPPPPGLAHGAPPSSASEGATAVNLADRRNENNDNKNAGGGNIRNVQHPAPSTHRMRKVPAAFARYAVAKTTPATHVPFTRPLTTAASWPTGQPFPAVQSARSTPSTDSTAQHQNPNSSTSSTLWTPRTTPLPPSSSSSSSSSAGPPSAKRNNNNYSSRTDDTDHYKDNSNNDDDKSGARRPNAILAAGSSLFPGLGPVVRTHLDLTQREVDVNLANMPRLPIPPAWHNPYTLAPMAPRFPCWTPELERRLRAMRLDLYGNDNGNGNSNGNGNANGNGNGNGGGNK